jgi:hypothetical protein
VVAERCIRIRAKEHKLKQGMEFLKARLKRQMQVEGTAQVMSKFCWVDPPISRSLDQAPSVSDSISEILHTSSAGSDAISKASPVLVVMSTLRNDPSARPQRVADEACCLRKTKVEKKNLTRCATYWFA